MATRTRTTSKPEAQDVCIDLPGEAVRCWRSSDKIRVILRKHRDVVFDINVKPGASYTVEATSSFYSPRDKKLRREAVFADGERFNLWVGRNFRGSLVLKAEGKTLGTYEVNKLDSRDYGPHPQAKPEPLLIVMGHHEMPKTLKCTLADPFGVGSAQQSFKPSIDPKLALLKDFGSEFQYEFSPEPTQVNEYVAVTEAQPGEIQPQVLAQLDSGVAVVGNVGKIFVAPARGREPSSLYIAMASAVGYISGSELWTSNSLKETLGYLQENFRALDKVSMTVRIERRVNGKYRVAFKGRPLSQLANQAFGAAKSAARLHERVPLGSHGSSFIDGGFGRTGRAGYGGTKRIMLTAAEKFRSGVKIQVVGTVVDIIVDTNTVYFDEKGSKELSEFLARAGVSIFKAGATAAIGSMFAALVTGFFVAAGAPVALIVGLVIVGYILAATVVDLVDSSLQIKERAASAAR